MSSVQKNLEEIKADIYKYSKNPDKVKLIAVTKYVEISQVREVLDAGHFDLGENRVQMLMQKVEELKDNRINWHLIGQLQKNKVKYIADFIGMIHSLDSVGLAEEINKRAKNSGRKVDVLIECNISGEDTKSGYAIDKLLEDVVQLSVYENLNIKGLMTMAPLTDNICVVQKVFADLRELKDRLNREFFNNSLTELSMGMSNDYKTALEEGATIIRIGTKIFK